MANYFYATETCTTISPGQNVVFCARIYNHNAPGNTLPVSQVSSITYTAKKLAATLHHVSGTAIAGHTNVTVPVIPTILEYPITDEFWHTDEYGYNFIHEPDVTVNPLFSEVGNYELVYTLSLTTGNPIIIAYKILVVTT